MNETTPTRQPSLGARFGLLFFIIGGLFSCIIVMTFLVLRQTTNDGLLINIAGRQRMLSQRIAKQMAAHSFLRSQAGWDGREKLLRDAEASIELFASSLHAMRHGGKVTSPDGRVVTIRAVADPATRRALEVVQKEWDEQKARVTRVLWGTPTVEQLAATIESADKILRESNTAVSRLQQAWDEKLTMLQWGQLVCLALVVSILLLSWLRGIRATVTRPLGTIGRLLRRTSHQTAQTASKVNESSDRVTEASLEQSDAIQETVAAMNEITAMVSQTTQRAQSSANEAKEALMQTDGGKRTMASLVNAVEAIAQSNMQLQSIVGIIDDISDRTNIINDIVFKTKMLAINAAVEAARAGQHGKGFSVVASEVGNLAQISGAAADEIHNLLRNSKTQVGEIVRQTQSRVGDCREVTESAELAFADIARAVERVSQQTGGIEEAAAEQELGIKQTTLGIEQIHRGMIKARSVSEDSRLLFGELNDQAADLLHLSMAMNLLVHGTATGADEPRARRNEVDRLLNQAGRGNDPTHQDVEGRARDEDGDELIRRLTARAAHGAGGRGPAENSQSDLKPDFPDPTVKAR